MGGGAVIPYLSSRVLQTPHPNNSLSQRQCQVVTVTRHLNMAQVYSGPQAVIVLHSHVGRILSKRSRSHHDNLKQREKGMKLGCSVSIIKVKVTYTRHCDDVQ